LSCPPVFPVKCSVATPPPVKEITGLPDTPSPFVIAMPVPAVSVLPLKIPLVLSKD